MTIKFRYSVVITVASKLVPGARMLILVLLIEVKQQKELESGLKVSWQNRIDHASSCRESHQREAATSVRNMPRRDRFLPLR